MTDWFKNNPFFAALSAFAAVVLVAGGYLLFAELGRLDQESSSFGQKKTQLQRLQANKPFPNQANVEATRKEAEEAVALLQELAKELSVEIPATSPQAFQDELAGMVKEIAAKAAAKKIGLPENFYLGFEQYETQLPPADIAPRLSIQLRTVNAVALALLDSQVESLGSIVRTPVRGEAGSAETKDQSNGSSREEKDQPQAPDLEIVPFDIVFKASQSAFRTAFNRISELRPPVFVRLVAIENSSPLPPSKSAVSEASGGETQQPAPQSGIRPVVGRDTVNVSLRLAGVVAPKPASP